MKKFGCATTAQEATVLVTAGVHRSSITDNIDVILRQIKSGDTLYISMVHTAFESADLFNTFIQSLSAKQIGFKSVTEPNLSFSANKPLSVQTKAVINDIVKEEKYALTQVGSLGLRSDITAYLSAIIKSLCLDSIYVLGIK